jgi:hypothetical protein
MRVAAKHARPSPLHHLPYPRRHLFDLLTQAFAGELFDDAARPFDPRGDLAVTMASSSSSRSVWHPPFAQVFHFVGD